MAKENLTVTSNITVTPREIDFVSRFQENWRALLDIMGVSRPIRKEPGTVLKSKKATVVLEDGNVGEGEEIPYSKATVTEVPYDDIKIEKYAKAVSIEAINEHGYDTAVARTDNQFLYELQSNVTAKFYNYLNTGTLKAEVDTWQKALAIAKGSVENEFKKMHLTATEVVGFANTMDFYNYLGAAPITVQTAFGFTYITNFMGYRVLFLLSDVEIPQGRVIATPVENIVMYYVNPSDSAFARADLAYTTVGVTPLIGFHTQGDYRTAVSECYAITGMTLFAEYLNGIAVVDVEGEIGTLGTLTVNSVAGATSGTTKITITEAKKNASNVYKYKLGEAAEDVEYNQNVRNWQLWDGTSDIAATTGQTITVVEATPEYNAVAAGSKAVTVAA